MPIIHNWQTWLLWHAIVIGTPWVTVGSIAWYRRRAERTLYRRLTR